MSKIAPSTFQVAARTSCASLAVETTQKGAVQASLQAYQTLCLACRAGWEPEAPGADMLDPSYSLKAVDDPPDSRLFVVCGKAAEVSERCEHGHYFM